MIDNDIEPVKRGERGRQRYVSMSALYNAPIASTTPFPQSMPMKNIMTLVLMPLVMVGCAASTTIDALREASLLRDERRLPMTHAQVQKALLQHERLCGRGATFALHARNTNEATVVQTFSDPPQVHRTVLVDMQQVYGWDGLRMVAKAYANFQVSDDEVNQVFAAVLDPASCP